MHEVIKQVADRAHISEDQARTAVQAVVDFMKQRLPPQMTSQLDAVMSDSSSNVGDAAKGIGGMFGH